MNDLPERHSPTYPDAMTRPIERPTLGPGFQLNGPHRARRQRRALRLPRVLLYTLGAIAVADVIARLVLRIGGWL